MFLEKDANQALNRQRVRRVVFACYWKYIEGRDRQSTRFIEQSCRIGEFSRLRVLPSEKTAGGFSWGCHTGAHRNSRFFPEMARGFRQMPEPLPVGETGGQSCRGRAEQPGATRSAVRREHGEDCEHGAKRSLVAALGAAPPVLRREVSPKGWPFPQCAAV